jgi:hypothetical protein
MSLERVVLITSLLFLLAGEAFALPAPYSEAELEAAATLIVDAEVTDAECLGAPLTEEFEGGGTKTVSSYRSTLTVSVIHEGEPPEVLTIVGTKTTYEDASPPVGGWTQPAYPTGVKGKFYLKPATGEGYVLVWWNGLIDDEDSAPGELPDCAGAPCEPSCQDEGGETKTCGDDGCGGSCGTCADDEVCNENGFCSQLPCDPDCEDRFCGDDLCGGTCGECDTVDTCDEQGQCIACVPECTMEVDGQTMELNCGDDGCGGSCGVCEDPSFCEGGLCTEIPCDPASIPGETMCGSNGCGGDWGDCTDGQVCGAEGFCVDDTVEPEEESSGGCYAARVANGPASLGFGLALVLLALLIRGRRTEVTLNRDLS